MRVYDQGGYFRVKVSKDEVEHFISRWPGSGLPDRSIEFEFQKSNGDLVDIHPDDIDGPDAVALAEDARKFGMQKLGLQRDNPRSRTKTSLPYKGDPGLRRLMRPSTSRSRRAAAAPDLDKDATYTVRGYPGIAWYTRGYVVETRQWDRYAEDEPEPEEDRSRAVMVMVGDDRKHIIDIDDLTKIGEDEYCHTCGQIGCTHNI